MGRTGLLAVWLLSLLGATNAKAVPFTVLFETDVDVPTGAAELALVSYASIADIVAGTSVSTVFTDLGVAAGYSSTGITYDGLLYHLLFETDLDVPTGGAELAIVSYASIADIVAGTSVNTMFTDLGVATGYSSRGFEFDGSLYHILFESDVDLPTGAAELAIVSYASIADIVAGTSVSTVFTDLGVAAGYSSAGLLYVPPSAPDPDPTRVPEPGSLSLLVAGLLGFGFVRGRRPAPAWLRRGR